MMNHHFTSFTTDAMKAFGQDLADLAKHRTEGIADIRTHTEGLLSGFMKELHVAAAKRRDDAADDAEVRHTKLNALRSEVQTLRDTFTTAREEMAADIKEMATELRQVCETFRNRPRADGSPDAKVSHHAGGKGKSKHSKQAD